MRAHVAWNHFFRNLPPEGQGRHSGGCSLTPYMCSILPEILGAVAEKHRPLDVLALPEPNLDTARHSHLGISKRDAHSSFASHFVSSFALLPYTTRSDEPDTRLDHSLAVQNSF